MPEGVGKIGVDAEIYLVSQEEKLRSRKLLFTFIVKAVS
jgi:hypothetical protein